MSKPEDREHALHAKTYGELRKMTVEDLIAAHDQRVNANYYKANPGYYLQEIERREQDRQTKTMVKLTKWIGALTVVNVVAVIVGLLLAA